MLGWLYWDGHLGRRAFFYLEEFLEKEHSDSAIFEISILELLDHPHVIHLVDVLLLVANSIQLGGVHASCKWPWSAVLAIVLNQTAIVLNQTAILLSSQFKSGHRRVDLGLWFGSEHCGLSQDDCGLI
jgi:hypothetical protein